MSSCSSSSDESTSTSRSDHLLLRLQQLQCHFTWDLKLDSGDLENLRVRLQNHIELQIGQGDAMARSYSLMAYVRFLQGQPDDAESLLIQSEEMIEEVYGMENQRFVVIYGDRAWLKYHAKDYSQSETYCQRVQDILSKYSTDSSVLPPEVYGTKAWTFLKFSRKFINKSIECFRKALEVQPQDSEWNTGYAIALHRTEEYVLKTIEDVEDSPCVKQFRVALQISPHDAVLQSMLAVKLGAYKKYIEAENLVREALKNDPDNPHVCRYIGKYFRNQDHLNESIDLLQRSLKRDCPSAFIHHQLALCYKRKKNLEHCHREFCNPRTVRDLRNKCIVQLEEAVKIKDSFVLAWTDLALLYGENKDLKRAEKIFHECSQKLLESETSLRQIFHQRCGDFHFYHNRNEAEAIHHYKENTGGGGSNQLMRLPEVQSINCCWMINSTLFSLGCSSLLLLGSYRG
ncbi:interferon-induced protein with tetratricopeptide repeats 10 isoform 2-T2 [Pholidichthys leucotaenia]